MPEHIFQNFAYAHLKEAISASATQMTLLPGDVEQWLERWEAGEIFHLTLLDNRNRLEIVKVTNISGDTLDITRGQGGTTSKAWPIGAVIAHRVVSASVEQSLQKGTERSGAYNPHGVVTASFIGEKFYDTANARHFIALGGTNWKLLTGALTGNEFYDGNGWPISKDWLVPIADNTTGLIWTTAPLFEKIDQGIEGPGAAPSVMTQIKAAAAGGGCNLQLTVGTGPISYMAIRVYVYSGNSNNVMRIKVWNNAVSVVDWFGWGPGEDYSWPFGPPGFGAYTEKIVFPSITLAQAQDLSIECWPVTIAGSWVQIMEFEIEAY